MPQEVSWRQAMDNIRAGQIRLEDNHPFTATGLYYGIAHTAFQNIPSIILEVDCTGAPNEAYITFKDGSKFGVEFLSKDTRIHYRHFIYFPEYPVTGQTTAGTNFTWSDSGSFSLYFDYYHAPAQATIPLYVDRIATSFVMFLNSDGTIDIDSYNLKYIDYVIQAHNDDYISLWREDFVGPIPDICTYGIFGYLESQSHIVDWLCGQNSPPAVYPGDPTGTGGGDGTFYNDSYDIWLSDCPGISAISLGFNTIYTPSVEVMQTISSWLWSRDFDEAINLNYISPFENIIALAIVPLDLEPLSTNSYLRVGNVDSEIACNRLLTNQQYQHLDFGTIPVKEKWGSFLDYNATYAIYLPMIGFRMLKPDDMVNGELGVAYWCDILTGLVVAEIYAKKNGFFQVLYNYTGNMFYTMAISGANFMTMYNQQLSAVSSGINSVASAIGQGAGGSVAGAVGGVATAFTGVSNAIRQYETARPDYMRGGNNAGNAGLFSKRFPYLIQCLPEEKVPDNYRALNGVPSETYSKLGDLTGYTEIDRVIVNTLTCTEEEQTQIIQQLKEGVIL